MKGLGPLLWIPRLIAALWRFSRRSWVGIDPDLRPRSPASGLVLFLFLLFFLIGLVLVLLGVDLAAVDRWIDRQLVWLEPAASLLFRILSGLVMLLCAFMLGWALLGRDEPERPGIGCSLVALIVAYFAWFGMVGD
jgi:hypothetical protein